MLILSEIASFQLEFRALGHLTGRSEYVTAVGVLPPPRLSVLC